MDLFSLDLLTDLGLYPSSLVNLGGDVGGDVGGGMLVNSMGFRKGK